MGILDDLGGLFGGSTDAAPAASVPQTSAPVSAPLGFIGGLMGASPNSPDMGFASNAIGALGQSLMTSPSNNLLRDFGSSFQAQTKASTADAQKQQIIAALKSKGLTDDQIMQALRQSGMLSPLDMLGQATGLTSFAASSPSPTPQAGGTSGSLGFGTPDQIANNRTLP